MDKLDIKTIKEVRRRYIGGQPKSEIASELKISYNVVEKYINDEGLGKLIPSEFKDLYAETKIENEKILEVKKQMLALVESAIQDAMSSNNKYLFIDKFTNLLNSLDRIYRLNLGEATDRTEHVEKRYDAAEILKQFPTTEDKIKFLKGQLENKYDN
jgi:hypothetical protein